MSPDDTRHGTNAGYLKHYRGDNPTEPCAECKAARTAYNRKRRELKPRASRFICVACLNQRAKTSGGTCRTCLEEIELTGGRWVLDPVRRVQVWEVFHVA